MVARRRMLLVIFLVALALRGLFVATRTNALEWPDAEDYDAIARNVLAGNGFAEADGTRGSRAPGYPLFLAACYAARLESPRSVYVIQALAGALACVLIALLGRELYGHKVGLIAGWISACYPFFIYYSGLMLTETLFILGIVACVLCLAHTQRRLAASKRRLTLLSAGTGVVLGLAVLLRSSLLLFPFFLLPFWLIACKPRRRAALTWGVMLLAMSVTMAPWVVRNYRLFGHIVPTTLQVGPSLYEANSTYADGGPAMHRIDWVEERGGIAMSEYDNNRFFKQAALRYMRANPARVLTLAVEKARRFWNVIPNYSPYRKLPYAAISLCTYVPVILLAIAAFVLRRGQARPLLILLPPVCYYAALHMVFVGSTRYRTGIMPFVILISAAGVKAAWDRLRPTVPANASSRGLAGPMGPVRRRILWSLGIVLVLCVTAAAAWRHYLGPERLRLAAQQRLARIAGGEVLVANARFRPLRGLVLRDVRIEDAASEKGLPAARIGTVLLCPAWSDLFAGRPAWRTVELEDVEINAQFDDTGRWTFLDQVHLAGETSGPAPTVFISRARLRVSGLAKRMGLPEVEFSRLNATFRSADPTGETYDVAIWSEERKRGRPRVTARVEPRSQRLRGEISIFGLSLDEQVRNSLPLRLQALWDDLALEGSSALEVNGRFSWDPRRAKPFHMSGKSYVNVGAFRHKTFPYPVTNLRAEADFDGLRFRVGWFHAFAGKAEISGAGEGVFTTEGSVSGNATIRAKGLVLDETLRDSLPMRARRIWKGMRPGGTVDVLAHFKAPAGLADPEVYAEVVLDSCTCAPRQIPVAMTDVTGRLILAHRRLTLRGVQGKAGGAEFTMRDGFVSLEPKGPFRVGLEVRRLRLEGSVASLMPSGIMAALPSAAGAFLKEGTIACNTDVSVDAARQSSDEEASFKADVTVRNLTFSHRALPTPVTRLNTRLHLTERSLELGATSAYWGDARIEIPRTRADLSPSAGQSLEVRIRNLALDKALYDLLPERVRGLWDRFGAEGRMDAVFRLARAAGPDKPFRLSGVADFREMKLLYVGFPYPISDVTGRMEVAQGRMRRAVFQGRNGSARISLTFEQEQGGGKPGACLVVEAAGAPLDEQLRNALSASHQALWNLFKPEGTMDFRLEHQFLYGSAQARVFPYSVNVMFPQLSLQGCTPAKASRVSLTVRQVTHEESGRATVRGRLSIENLSVEQTRVSGLRASFRSHDGGILVEGISADCYGGKLIGTVSVSGGAGSNEPMEFSGAVNLVDADLARIVEHRFKQRVSGRLTASGTFSGRLSDSCEFHAVGAMTIREGEIGKLPGILAVLNLFRFYGLDAPAFHDVELVYELKDGKLYAHEINFTGDILSLRGHGEVDRDGKMSFRFIPEIGPKVNIPGLGKLLDFVKEKAIPITVRGGPDDPIWHMNPVLSVTRTVQDLLQDLLPLKLVQAKEE